MSAAAAPAAEAPKKKGKMKGILTMLVVALLFAGIGAGAGMYAAGAGLAGGGHEKAPEDPNTPKLVAKEGAESGSHGSDKKTLPIDGIESDKSPDPTKYKATYYAFEQPFTSNLRDSDGFSQVGLGVSTFYDQKVLDNLKDNEMPIRSAILMVLSQQDSFTISTPEGKLKLQKDLKDGINSVLRQRTGFGGIDNVYFTTMVVQ
ncbi:MAG: flagellar basal body-associated FliL family protein [Pseudomonadota bacterium]